MRMPDLTRREFAYGALMTAARQLLAQIEKTGPQTPTSPVSTPANIPSSSPASVPESHSSESMLGQISNIVSQAISQAHDTFNDQASVIGHLGFSVSIANGPTGVTVSGGVMAGYNPATTEISFGGYSSVTPERVESLTPQANVGVSGGLGVGNPSEGFYGKSDQMTLSGTLLSGTSASVSGVTNNSYKGFDFTLGEGVPSAPAASAGISETSGVGSLSSINPASALEGVYQSLLKASQNPMSVPLH